MISPGNICRGKFGLMQINQKKTVSLQKELSLISPFSDILVYDELVKLPPGTEKIQLEDKLRPFDIIFDCTANNTVIQLFSDTKLSGTVFHISISDRAQELICVTSADSGNLFERRNQMLYSFGNYAEATFREGTGCYHPTFEASYFDINLHLNTCLQKLNNYYKNRMKPRSFFSFLNNNALEISEDFQYIQKDTGLKLTVTSHCLDKVTEVAFQHYPNEIGGILLGSYLNNYTEVVISDIIVPQKFKSSRAGFSPDHHEINKKLLEVDKKFDGKIEYLGDWHTHPDNSNHYSMPDLKSIRDVALSKTVNTHNPLLLIVAFSKDYFEPGFYVYFKEKVLKYTPV